MGPLGRIRVVEFAGIGPAPFCAMMLADMGAQVLRIDRPNAREAASKQDVLNRGRCSITVELKSAEGLAIALRLISQADALIEGFRPGVMERLGLGPDVCLKRNPRLIYGRVTGWGQTGPLRYAAGHDINYIALTGALHCVGPPEKNPMPPLNLIGDFGGGGMLLAFGVVCGILEAHGSGRGQVVDAAIVDGAALQMSMIYGWKAARKWSDRRGGNLLDGGAPFYRVYECSDGKFVAIGALEPQFFGLLLDKLALTGLTTHAQMDELTWPDLRSKFTALFQTRTRDEWCRLLEGTDACFAPVLDLNEAPLHPHNAARQTFIEIEGVVQPAPAPRFSRTKPNRPCPPSFGREATQNALADWGFSSDEILELQGKGTL